jgi:hypothetical protein
MNYMISRVTLPKGICNLGAIKNVPGWARMMNGASQIGQFPEEAQFQMDPDRPKDVKLADVLENMNSFLIVSERLKDLFVTWNALKKCEVLPVGILNHKGRLEKAHYFIIHQVDHPQCVDEGQSIGEKSPLDPSEYISVTKLVFDESKIDPELAILRPLEYRNRAFFRRDIVDKILTTGITGLKFYEVESYTAF